MKNDKTWRPKTTNEDEIIYMDYVINTKTNEVVNYCIDNPDMRVIYKGKSIQDAKDFIWEIMLSGFTKITI